MSEAVALIGAGIMGQAIGTRLLESGHRLSVYDIDAGKAAQLASKGASLASSPAEAAARADFIILSLNHADIVEKAVFGPQGVAEAASAARLLIDMSSIDPGATAAMAARLEAASGMGWVDGPLSGGAPGALAGRLTIMAGGSEQHFERARLVMKDLAANYTLMGASGAGQTTKLVNQLFCALAFQAVAEAVKLAEAGGVDPARIPSALAGGRADGRILQEFTPTGSLANMLKDLESIEAFALKTRTPLPLTSQVAGLHRLMIAMGLGSKDNAEAMRLLDGG
jgi:2-hydroxy-3-oxopropionate reductase